MFKILKPSSLAFFKITILFLAPKEDEIIRPSIFASNPSKSFIDLIKTCFNPVLFMPLTIFGPR